VPRKRQRQAEDDLFDWFTITYRSILIGGGAILGAALAAFYFYFGTPRPVTPTPSPLQAPPVAKARFSSVEGNVLLKRAGTLDWVPAEKGMALSGGDTIRSTSAATAEIAFFDGTFMQLQAGALMTIEKTLENPATKSRTVAARLSAGTGTVETSNKNVPSSTTEVSTPTVKGTIDERSKAALGVTETGESDIRVLRGGMRAETKGGQTIELGPSEGLKVNPGGSAGPKVTLPAIPVLVTPPHLTELVYPDPARSITLSWKAVPGAAAYHLMLDYSAYFNRPLVDRKDIHENRQEIRGLDLGKYYWRVAAIDKNGVEGGFSIFFGFTIAQHAREEIGVRKPPLTIEFLDVWGNILQIRGRTEAGGAVTVNDQRVDVDADGRFSEVMALDKVGRQEVVIRVTGLNGGAREDRRVVVGSP
jgi:hypothetical protein